MRFNYLNSKSHERPSLRDFLDCDIGATFYPPLGSNNQDTYFTAISAPSSILHQDGTITSFFASSISVEPLIVEIIRAKGHTEKNQNISYAFQQPCEVQDITYTRLRIIESIRNVRTFLDYINQKRNNQINEKCLLIPSIF